MLEIFENGPVEVDFDVYEVSVRFVSLTPLTVLYCTMKHCTVLCGRVGVYAAGTACTVPVMPAGLCALQVGGVRHVAGELEGATQ